MQKQMKQINQLTTINCVLRQIKNTETAKRPANTL